MYVYLFCEIFHVMHVLWETEYWRDTIFAKISSVFL